MSGHSKWANIKHRKGRQDEKKGKLFGRMIREITVAARSGGGDINANPRLRRAVATAQAANMPKDNWERAIAKGTGELEGMQLEEVTYGGYGPGGVAILLEVVTDNRNRTTPEIRNIFSRNGGSLAETSAVTHLFERKGYVLVDGEATDEETLMETVLDAGAEDLTTVDGNYEVLSKPNDFDTVLDALEAKNINPIEAQISMIPITDVQVEGKTAEQMLRMMEMLDDHDDVQNVWANFDIVEED